MNAIEIRKQIEDSLHNCGAGADFASAANAMLSALGYVSERMDEIESEPKAFVKKFPALNSEPGTESEQRFVAAAKSVHLLFQSGESEIEDAQKKMQEEGQDGLLPNFSKEHIDEGDIKSFLFLAVDLEKDGYRRGDYAAFTREINKRFLMPSMVLFRCGNAARRRVTLSFVWRRVSKTDPALDVLGRVSLLREINCDRQRQHRGHLDILEQLTLENRLRWMQKKKVEKFEGLLAAWLNELDAEALNQRFYADLCKWFDYAVNNAKFPTNRKVTTQLQIVRMVSRLLFIWFMKEKGLVCEDFFDEEKMRDVLVNYDCDNDDSYYRAILQNLFFATLNTEINNRDFSSGNQKTHRIPSFYRYKNLMKKSGEVLAMMKETPFVNGGLFDCLDDLEGVKEGGERVDCFTENKTQRKELHVPNSLFFGEKGVFNIFEKYKFTVEENTPIEQEVALDPELLGKVFEEFLGSIAPEETTAPQEETAAPQEALNRRETGSYYTPRIIVDYMVRESLATYFARTIESNDKKLHEKIHRLLSAEVEYEILSEDEKLSKSESESFVMAAGKLRLLDPAVGSGAFPMGALQQMTMALKRADSENTSLKKRELEVAKRFEDSRTREKAVEMVEEIFAEENNYNDYGRKLSLIRDCLFGVDMQPIAVQICRLRFFISLLIEQQVDKEKENFGIRPLPNMDTKIIATDTLIPMSKKSSQHELYSEEVKESWENLLEIRRRFFSAKTRKEKLECRDADQKTRQKLAILLKNSVGKDAQKIADWDLYDQNASAKWFDPSWMFGVDDGFSIVIGNPPYNVFDSISKDSNQAQYVKKIRESYEYALGGKINIYRVFIEKCALGLLAKNGLLSLIVPNTLLADKGAAGIRKMFAGNMQMHFMVEFPEDIKVFENVTQATVIFRAENGKGTDKFLLTVRHDTDTLPPKNSISINWDEIEKISGNDRSVPLIKEKADYTLIQKLHQGDIVQLGRISSMKQGDVNMTFHGPYIYSTKQSHLLARGEHVSRYYVNLSTDNPDRRWISIPKMHDELTIRKMRIIEDDISIPRIICQNICNMGMKNRIVSAILPPGILIGHSAKFILPNSNWDMLAMLAILNSSIINWRFKTTGSNNNVSIYELENLPFPVLSQKEQVIFSELAGQIIKKKEKKRSADTSALETEIDERLYTIYKLTAAERKIIEEG